MSIELTGIEEIERELARLKAKGENLRPLLSEIANEIKNTTSESFQNESSADGKKWQGLKGSKRKNDKRKNGRILQDKGQLASSINSRVDSNSVTIGTNLEYAPIHQFGGLASRGKSTTIVARPFMPISKDGNLERKTKEAIEKIAFEWIKS